MAKSIVLTYDGEETTFPFAKLTRDKLYGKRKRVVLDSDDQPCRRAELTIDGSLLLQSGMTAQGYFDEEGVWIPNAALTGLDANGEELPKQASTLGVAQDLTPIEADELLEVRAQNIYLLDVEGIGEKLKAALAEGQLFRFPFNYRPDYHSETGYLVGNDEGVFVLIGERSEAAWCELERPADTVFVEDDEEDDLDFDMF